MDDPIAQLKYDGGVTALDSGQFRPMMAACYILEADQAVALIEVGNNASAGRILKTLESLGREREEVTHVIPTHVHLDHAGGAGRLMQELPNATLYIHPRGARHMIDPSRLEAGARAVYGDAEFDRQYGSLIPIDEQRVRVMEDGECTRVGDRPLEFIDTPGHARHHFCVWDAETRGWFSGDTFGTSYRDFDTSRGAWILPTTTPIQFDPPALKESVDRLMTYEPDYMYLTHFGRVEDTPRLAEEMKSAVDAFVEMAETHANHPRRTQMIEEDMRIWAQAGLDEHGVDLPAEEVSALLATDIRLNTQGIEFWLETRE